MCSSSTFALAWSSSVTPWGNGCDESSSVSCAEVAACRAVAVIWRLAFFLHLDIPAAGFEPLAGPSLSLPSLICTNADEMVPVPGDDAIATAKKLAANEGLLVGVSGGGTMYAALEVAKKAPKGSVILAMLPDTGERYLSTPLFAEIAADMNDEELEIARSTPNFVLEPTAA